MSRIGKQPIEIPKDVQIQLNESDISVKGPKGSLSLAFHPMVHVKQEENFLHVDVKDQENNKQKALWGLFKRLVSNMMTGVTQGFTKQLEINGVGYRAQVQGNKLILNVGFSHQVEFPLPEGVSAIVDKNVITLNGIDKQLVGQTAAEIRKIRKPEPYNGKGIKYVDEVIIRKSGKSAKTA